MFVAGAKLYLVFTRTCSEAKTCHGVYSTFMGAHFRHFWSKSGNQQGIVCRGERSCLALVR